MRAIGRLKAGRSVEQAERELDALAATLARQHPASNTGRTVRVRTLAAAVAGDLRAPLWMLQAATGTVLLIVCANLANLLLAAGSGRASELAVRAALGASRVRIVRQLLTEGLVLASAGGLLGVGLAWGATALLADVPAISEFHRRDIKVDPTVLLFTVIVSAGAGVLFAWLPALQVARASLRPARYDGPRHTDGPAGRRLRSGLVMAEVAMSVMLIIGAALLVRSFWQLTRVDPGFRTDQVLSFQVALSPRQTAGTAHLAYDQLYDRLRSLPTVKSAGAVNILPLSGNYSCDGFQIVGREAPEGQGPCAEARSAGGEYFATMGIRLLQGRWFDATDGAASERVIVINETMARGFFPGESPVGRLVVYSSHQNDPRRVVGVISDVHHFGLDRAPAPEFYVPHTQPPSYTTMTVVLRVDGDPAAVVPDVRSALRAIDPQAPLYNVRLVEDLRDRSLGDARLRTFLLALFAGLALLLAVLGTYGVMAVAVSQRSREMGIRLALGARAPDVVRLIVAEGLRPVLAGAVIGLAGGYALSEAIAGLLFGVTPRDPLAFVLAPLVMTAAALAAAWIPARRACCVDPAITLRPE